MGIESEKYYRRKNQAERIAGFLLLGLLLLVGYCTFLLGTGESPNIPEDVSFSVVEEYTKPSGSKRQLDIRLNKKVTQSTLREIALYLKDREDRTYKRTFMIYYLPELPVGEQYWATTHFNPELEVKIFGFTIEEERKFKNMEAPPNREIIGRWLNDRLAGAYIEIYREGEKLFSRQIFKNLSEHVQEMVEKNSQSGRRFERVEGSEAGDHWLITSDGKLEVRDNEGLIFTAQKIE